MDTRVRNMNYRLLESFYSTPTMDQCDTVIEEPTLFLIRYEYANLFHTSTDWCVAPHARGGVDLCCPHLFPAWCRYNAYLATRILGYGPLPVVFVDGHCQSPMDDAWQALFPKIQYIKHFQGTVCFKHMILVPTGYQAAISTGLTPTVGCPANPRVREFGDMMLRAFGIEPLKSCRDEGKNQLTMVRRENYKAHPRHNSRIDTRLSNEQSVVDALQRFVERDGDCTLPLLRACFDARLALTASLPRCACAVTHFVEGRFAHMTFKEQLYAVSRSCALVGAHGAGMTHVLFMPPDARVLEMRTPGFHRHHFEACVTSTTSVQRGWWRIGAHPCACVCMCGQVFAVGWVAIRKVGHIKLIAGPEYSGFEALIGALTATRRPYSALAALTRALCCHSY